MTSETDIYLHYHYNDLLICKNLNLESESTDNSLTDD
jgi:hypothetical protein